MRRNCLDRSIAAAASTALDLDYLPVDNRGQVYATAGAALNQGVRNARHDYVAFVQQDVYLHSIVALEEAAARMAADSRLGMVGAIGMTAAGGLVGRVRDRVLLLGESTRTPKVVDSVDEILFLAPREQLLSEPLSEDPALAWHAYAVEYGLRVRASGQEVVAVDLPLTHNSLSTNVLNLDGAHAHVAELYPDDLPVTTTCGTITARSRSRRAPLLAHQRWRLRWLRESLVVRQAQEIAPNGVLVLADLRWDIDLIGERLGGTLMHIHNCTDGSEEFPDPAGGTVLNRRGYDVLFTSGPMDVGLAGLTDGHHLLTNLGAADLQALQPHLRGTPHVTGFDEAVGFWVLLGPLVSSADHIWATPRSKPSALALGRRARYQ